MIDNKKKIFAVESEEFFPLAAFGATESME